MDRHARALQAHSFDPAGFTQRIETATRSRFRTSLRTAERDRFASDDTEFGMTAYHRDRVHDPRHCLLVGVNVGRGNVAIGTNDGRDLESVAARQSLQLVLRKTFWIAD